METVFLKILSVITDATMLFSLVMVGGLFYLLVQRDKAVGDLFIAIKEQSNSINECNASIGSLTTLIEVLVYGKGGKRL